MIRKLIQQYKARRMLMQVIKRDALGRDIIRLKTGK
jgi:hypothetical protein